MRAFLNHHTQPYILIICVWVMVLASVSYMVAKPVRDASIDFFGYYISASAIHQGKPIFALETHESLATAMGIQKASLVRYPPTLAVIIQPVLLMSPYAASLSWLGVNIVLLMIGIGLLFKQSNLRDHRIRVALMLLPVLFTPVLMNLYLGQVNILIFMLIVMVYLAFVHRWPRTSGLLLALSTWIKLWPIILIAYFLWKREWKVVAGAILGLFLIGMLTFAFAGARQTMGFFTDELPLLLNGPEHGLDHHNQSIAGVFAKLLAPTSDYVQPLTQNPTLARQGSRIVTLSIIAITIILCSWPISLKNRKQFSTEFMLVIIAAMLITGWLWEASFTLLLPAYFFIAEELQPEHFPNWRYITLSLATAVLIDLHRVIWTLVNPDKQALPWYLLIFPFLGLILMWMIFVVQRVRQIKAPQTSNLSEFVGLDRI